MSNDTAIHKIAIVDDHSLFASSLEKLVNTFEGYEVSFIAKNGKDFQTKLVVHKNDVEIVLLDINMPVMDGFATADWLTKNHPEIMIIALSMDDEEEVILKMLRKGAKGFLLKDIHPNDLKQTLDEVLEKGYHHTDKVSKTLINSLSGNLKEEEPLRENLLKFIELSCSEMNYREIAEEMNLSPKTIENYRQEVFEKLGVKNRVGLVLYAIKNKLFKP